MFHIIRLAFKNVIARKSSYAIILFIAFSIAILVVGNAVFDGTDSGIRSTFIESFTGDIVIRPVSTMPVSLFGDETPITGNLSEIDLISPYTEVYDFLQAQHFVDMLISQVSGMSMIDINGNRFAAALFGVDAQIYLSMMKGIVIEEGKPFTSTEKGIMLPRHQINTIYATTGSMPKIGDMIQLLIADGPTFRIRAVPLTGIYSYQIENETLNKIALIDVKTLRALMNISETVSKAVHISEREQDLFDIDMDSLFSESEDVVVSDSLFFSESDLKSLLTVTDLTPSTELDTAWNFIIVKLNEGVDANSKIRYFNRVFKKNNFLLEAVGWRDAAGKTALYMYWLRIIFNIGMYIVLCTGFIVVINSLIINVLDRMKEIGTMRSLGARKSFISVLCMSETLMITITAGIIGTMLGSIGVWALDALHITFTNEFLIQLFGGTQLVPALSALNVLSSFMLSVILGIVAWIYPVYIALQVTPISAMRGGS